MWPFVYLKVQGLPAVSTSSLPSLPRVHLGSQAIFRIFWIELFEFLLKGIVGECVTTRFKSIKASPPRVYVYLSRATHAQQTTALKSHSCFELAWVCKRYSNIAFIRTQGSYNSVPRYRARGFKAVVFKLNSRWPETRVCCPKTLCSGHLKNEGLRSESKGCTLRVHIGSQAIFRIFWI